MGKKKQSLLDFPASDKLNRGQWKREQQVKTKRKKYQEGDEKNQIKGKNLQKPKLLEKKDR